jgi:hypothetical protein
VLLALDDDDDDDDDCAAVRGMRIGKGNERISTKAAILSTI